MTTMQGNYLSPIIDAFKPILIFATVVWGLETIVTMLIKDHKKAKRKQAREKRIEKRTEQGGIGMHQIFLSDI